VLPYGLLIRTRFVLPVDVPSRGRRNPDISTTATATNDTTITITTDTITTNTRQRERRARPAPNPARRRGGMQCFYFIFQLQFHDWRDGRRNPDTEIFFLVSSI